MQVLGGMYCTLVVDEITLGIQFQGFNEPS